MDETDHGLTPPNQDSKVNRKSNEINDLPTPPPRRCWVCEPPVIALKTRGPPFALKGHALPEAGLGTPKRGTPAKNSVRFDARTSLFEASGVDLTRIPGIDTSTALKVISEIGVDLARFPTVKHFTSWLGLCPGTKISGGKVLSSATKPCANRAAQALRMAAQALRKSQTALGAHHRRLCSRMDKPKAITASAHKLARLVYFMPIRLLANFGLSSASRGQDR